MSPPHSEPLARLARTEIHKSPQMPGYLAVHGQRPPLSCGTAFLLLLTIHRLGILGNTVCAIGNQFGLGLSVTCGVISATARTGMGFNPIEDFIQTDTAINPGGSGGALVDQWGQLVGLVSAIFTKDGNSNIGVNFATSSALVYRVMEDLRDFGKVIRVKSGLSVRSLTDQQKQNYSGAEVLRVKYDSPAFIAKLERKDILIKIAKRLIRKPADVSSAFQFIRFGESAKIEFMRNHQLKETTIKF